MLVSAIFNYPCLVLYPAAGRDAPGKAFRLYTEAAFAALAAETVPEIKRVNLAATVLQLKVQVDLVTMRH